MLTRLWLGTDAYGNRNQGYLPDPKEGGRREERTKDSILPTPPLFTKNIGEKSGAPKRLLKIEPEKIDVRQKCNPQNHAGVGGGSQVGGLAKPLSM